MSAICNESQTSASDWTSESGQLGLTNLVAPTLNYTPFEYQLYDSGCILNGLDVLCISVTGGGKSGLIYIPAIARKDMIILVIEPTNFLEHDMARGLGMRSVKSVAINAEAQDAALRTGRNLWTEARDCLYQVITMSPESLRSPEFDKLLGNPTFYKRWGLLVVDEVHLLDEWGEEFRPLYQDIWSIRSRGPDGLVVAALSATVEPGRQTEAILKHLGFRRGKYHLDRRDCERHNVDFIFRDIKFPCTGHTFRDLDWLIPLNMEKAADVLKCLIYCETIEMGHRVVIYLRSLLPPRLKRQAHTLIRHMHSLNCPDCKSEGLAALYESGDARQTALFVTTAILEVGVDVPDIESVIMFPAPPSASSLVQRSGRPARGHGMHGKAIVYVKKTELESARKYSESIPADPRLLQTSMTPSTASTLDTDDAVSTPSTTPPSHNQPTDTSNSAGATSSQALAVKKGRKKVTTKSTSGSKASRGPCSSLLLIIAAHLRGLCVTRQINIIYGNPNMTRDCGRCSSCVPQSQPEPRNLYATPSNASLVQIANTGLAGTVPRIPGHRKITQKDCEEISSRLLKAAQRMLYSNNLSAPYTLFISPKCFLPPHFIKAISNNLHLITSEGILKGRLEGWRYWDNCGHQLWEAVSVIAVDIASIQDERHADSSAKRRATTQLRGEERENERVHADIVANGLGHIKRVKLVVSTRPDVSIQTAAPPPEPSAVPSGTINFLLRKRPLASTSLNKLSSKARRQTDLDTAPSVVRSQEKENCPGP